MSGNRAQTRSALRNMYLLAPAILGRDLGPFCLDSAFQAKAEGRECFPRLVETLMNSPLPRAGNFALAALVSLLVAILLRRRTSQSAE